MSFDVTVKTDSYSLWVPVQFNSVVTYCQHHHPEIGAYYRSVRNNVKGLGPKHSKMFEIMDEEDFDHVPYIHAYINDTYDLDEGYARHQKAMASANDAKRVVEQATEKSAALESHFPSLRKSALRTEAFMDNLMEYLNNEALARYPEVFNAEPELIEAFHGKLIDWVRSVGEGMDKLAFQAEQQRES